MAPTMFARLGSFVSRHWLLVIVAWVLSAVVLKSVAPSWSDIAYDGNFAYLPESMPSVAGDRLIAEAFPHDLAKSQVVLMLVREDAKLTNDDIYAASDIARRFRNLQGASQLALAKRLAVEIRQLQEQGRPAEARRVESRFAAALKSASQALDEAIRLDQALADYREERSGDRSSGQPTNHWRRLAAAYYNRSLLHRYLGQLQDQRAAWLAAQTQRPRPEGPPEDARRFGEQAEAARKASGTALEEAGRDRERAIAYDPRLASRGEQAAPDGAADWPLLDVWTWHDDVFGDKLTRPHARLVILQLSNEFMDTANIQLVENVEAELDQVRHALDPRLAEGLTIGLTGSAAIGGDLLRSARETIRKTELFTVLLVVVILAVVYRSPLLVVVPLVTISISLAAAMSLVALLAALGGAPGFGWFSLKVFTTTKVFIVVILFGAGTDYCLFLISRFREERAAGSELGGAIASSLAGVGDALAASALTTIFGLAMMVFADFGKFRHSGPVIGLCLAVTLGACVTLAPALLRACGGLSLGRRRGAERRLGESGGPDDPPGRFQGFWRWVAHQIVTHPGWILISCTVLLLPLGFFGTRSSHHVSYDFLSALDDSRPSKRGADLLKSYFPVGERGPVTILVEKPDSDFRTRAGRAQIGQLAHRLYLDGVTAVRSIADPLGDFPPGKKIGIFRQGFRNRLMRAHQRTQGIYLSQTPALAGKVARLEVVLNYDPFSIQADQVLTRIEARLREIRDESGSYWRGATFVYAGTTAAIRDLRAVTQSDTVRIQRLVVLAVLAVLLVILKRPLVCLFLIGSVLLSYYVTIGATELFFRWVYGPSYQGLDWRTPLFLFVILVAVGQDYNVYLVTRVFEEQARHGPFGGLRRAVVRTGGIITSCGVIMAGAFLSMTSGTWGHWAVERLGLPGWLASNGGALRGIVELGFALALGVTLDTFVVRPVLVPAFLALLCRWRSRSWAASANRPIPHRARERSNTK